MTADLLTLFRPLPDLSDRTDHHDRFMALAERRYQEDRAAIRRQAWRRIGEQMHERAHEALRKKGWV